MDTDRQCLEFSRHSCINAHKDKINDMKIDTSRGFLYSIGHDKRLTIVDLNEKCVVMHFKTANAKLKAMCIDQALKRLYVSSYDG